MSVTAIGVVVLALCLRYCGSAPRLLQLVFLAGVFDAAAALILGGFGMPPAFPPAIMLVGLLAMQYLAGRRSIAEVPALHLMTPLLLFFAYAAVTAVMLPEAFAGRIIVWPQKFADIEPQPVPIAPGQGNMNQVAYLAANVGLALATALAAGRAGTPWRAIVKAYLLSGYLVMVLVAWDFASRTVGLPFPSDIVYSNPSWSIVEQNIGSLPRLQGPFAEPSALAFYLAGLAFACMGLCLRGHRVMRPDLLLVMACFATFLSTSTTGIAALVVGLPAQLAFAAAAGRGMAVRRMIRVLAVPGTIALLLAAGLLVMRPELLDVVAEVIDTTIEKRESDSFTERSLMNTVAWNAFLSSGGLGVGWGSTRASSILPGLLAGAGLVGAVTTAWFGLRMIRLVRRARAVANAGNPALIAIDCFGAALAGQLLAAAFSAPVITTPVFFAQLGIVGAAAIRVLIDASARARMVVQAAAAPNAPPPLLQISGR
ncbi:hypothetical protein [Neoroseomonas oryzicola]|uniref:Uncharacterized protein n=1 Tax=Neoroseomonas oryzicola TaxID=535904 RepID=A0A9X9WHU3_9PROT|nr:hypothetical protein [Neoroseomonas oryzicola]MBR0659903.1 hypothetical protein [Neoroseomonas oryzicola]NKE15657.1 hypothetical protein [Neoroseomonas oryzicola]